MTRNTPVTSIMSIRTKKKISIDLRNYSRFMFNHFDRYVISLALSLTSVAFEFFGFLCGISMFSELHSLLCMYNFFSEDFWKFNLLLLSILAIVCHSVAAFIWSISYIERWDCSSPYSWYLFIFCSGLPLTSELAVFISFIRRVNLR